MKIFLLPCIRSVSRKITSIIRLSTMKQGAVFAFLVCCAFASYAAGQRNELDQCADYQLAMPAYYTCIIKCHQFVLGFDDSTADFCTSKFRLTKAKKNNYSNGDVVNTLKCIAIKCKQFVPNDMCEDSSSVKFGSSTEFSDFSTAFSTTTYEDGSITETSTNAPSSSETTMEDLASFSTPVFTSESTTSPSSGDSKTISPSQSPDISVISTTSSPMVDIPRTVRSNDEEPSSVTEECEEDDDNNNDGSKNDGSFSDATATTALYSDATATFASTDSTSYFVDEDCVSDDSSSEDGSTFGDGLAENGEDASATSQIKQSPEQPSQNISGPYVVAVSTDSPDSYFFKSLGGIFNDDMTPNDKTPRRNFDASNRYRNYASSEAGAAQDGSGSYAFSNSRFGNNNPQFPPNPNWISFGFDSPQAPAYNPQQGLAPGSQQDLAPGPQQIPIYNPPPRLRFNPQQGQGYGPQQTQMFDPQQRSAYNSPTRPLINPEQGLVNNPQQRPVYNPLRGPNSGNNGNFPQQNRRKRKPAQRRVIRRKKGAFPVYNQGNQIYGGDKENINNNGFQENTGRVPPFNNGGIRRIPPNLVSN